MSGTPRRRGYAAVALVAAVALAAAAGCSKSSDNASGGTGKITLHVLVFGDFGYKKAGLYDKYTQSHPNVTVVEDGAGQGLDDENNKLKTSLAAGTAPADVVALEEGTVTGFKAQAQNFVNLADYGADSVKGNYPAWKWDEGSTKDGQILGLGTDVGPLAMCYRTDLFAQAGLPTERDKVSALWPDWQSYITVGKQFVGKVKSAKFVDAATNLYNTILMQTAGNASGYTYFDKSDQLAVSSNADVKSAWDVTNQMIGAGLSAGLTSFSDDWGKGFKNATFATIACPAWMLANIKEDSGDSGAGHWDVADIPGGGGNWGGSFLSVPKAGKHLKEAADLATFLTSPDSQLAVFTAIGNMPSATSVWQQPAFTSFKNDYFNNAPIGEIFSKSAQKLNPVYLGAQNQPVRNAVEDALRSVEQRKKTADQAWADAVKNGTTAAKQ
jgi:cellobiose transport system substrate-binding protein